MTARIELRTERLRLRPFEAIDVDDAMAYRNDPEFSRFLPHIPLPFTRQDAETFVALNMSEPWDRSPTFAVRAWHTVAHRIRYKNAYAKEDPWDERSESKL